MVNEFDLRQQEFWKHTTNPRQYDHPVVRLFAQQRVRFIQRVLAPFQPKIALDVGCGDGMSMHYMRSVAKVVHGCDRSATMIRANSARADGVIQCDAYFLPWADSSVDLVYCWELLHHLGDPRQAVEEMARVAAKCVLICEPNSLNPAMFLFGCIRTEERGLLRFTPAYARKLLESEGLQHVKCYTVGCFTPNRTPRGLAALLALLPYRAPLLGMYTIAMGYKQGYEPG
jgi:SAM-dependent methyltransferase